MQSEAISNSGPNSDLPPRMDARPLTTTNFGPPKIRELAPLKIKRFSNDASTQTD
jgi:hypothetical protein